MAKKEKITPTDPLQQVKQEIANLCTTIGDRSYVVRQAQADITQFYSQIDALRTKLIALEKTDVGSEITK